MIDLGVLSDGGGSEGWVKAAQITDSWNGYDVVSVTWQFLKNM